MLEGNGESRQSALKNSILLNIINRCNWNYCDKLSCTFTLSAVDKPIILICWI
jgi:hypothetical protein